MTTAIKLVTAEELLEMGDAQYLELYDGELRTVSPANMRHGDIAGQIAMLLRQYVKPRKMGRIIVEGGYVLGRNPDTVLGPDVSLLSEARVPAGGLPEKFLEGFPNLAVEIISPTNSRREIGEKMARYMDAGTPLGWLVDPVGQTVDVYRAGGVVERLGREAAISGEEVIAGFACTVADFFD